MGRGVGIEVETVFILKGTYTQKLFRQNQMAPWENLKHCVLTGYRIDKPPVLSSVHGAVIVYNTPLTGNVYIGISTLNFLQQGVDPNRHPVLAGICREAYEKNVEPPIINMHLIHNELSNYNYPKTAAEKCRFLLKYIYDHGGNELKSFDMYSMKDYPICFADNTKQFEDLLDYMIDEEGWLTVKKVLKGDSTAYLKLKMTKRGKEEVQKELPQMPLIGLINQDIATGHLATDLQIKHAKDLFFREPQKLENMRSACETLSFVLEPMREELGIYFVRKDVDSFFRLVNEFDIRHNKQHTTKLVEPEQLEWVFYTLLNSINTFVKLKLRITN